MAEKQHRLKSVERRAQIKESILDIIYHDGLSKLSTRYLANKVGVSEGALFRHYASKNAMISDIVSDVLTDLVWPLEIISKKNVHAELRLKEFLCFWLHYLFEKKGITMLLFTEASYKKDVELKVAMYDVFRLQKQYFSHIIQAGIDEGVWSKKVSVESIASLSMGIPITFNIEMILNADDFNPQGYCEEMHQLILKILAL